MDKEIEEIREQFDDSLKNGDSSLAMMMLLVIFLGFSPYHEPYTKLKEDIAELKGKMSVIEKLL